MAMRLLNELVGSKKSRMGVGIEEEEPVLDSASERGGGSNSDDDLPSSSDEDIRVSRQKRPKLVDRTGKENRTPSVKSSESELSKTNALLQTLLKRMERQEKKLCEMESKLTQTSAPSSSDSTPRRRSAAERRKQVPQEVRVSDWLYIINNNIYVYIYKF